MHDIGHDFGPEATTACWARAVVRDLLGERVAGLVEAHVPAKRYLVTTDGVVRGACSPPRAPVPWGSKGALMDAAELVAFSSSPVSEDAVELRRADDAAKVAGPARARRSTTGCRCSGGGVADVGGAHR